MWITATGDAIGIIFPGGIVVSVVMAMTVRAAVRAAVILVAMLGAVVAGPLEDANGALKRKDYANAVRLYRPLADKGDPSAQVNLGSMYDATWCTATLCRSRQMVSSRR